MADRDTIRFLLPGTERPPSTSIVNGPVGRGGPAEAHEVLAGVTIRRHFDLSAAQRTGRQEIQTGPLEPDDVLALEMEDGFVFYTSAARLADDLRRINPQAESNGVIRLGVLQRDMPATRGLGDWVVRALSVLGVDEKWLIGKAAEKVQELGGAALVQGTSWAGTKAVMWAIEEQLARKPGHWLLDPRQLRRATPLGGGTRVASATRKVREAYLRLRAPHLLVQSDRECT